VVVLTCDNGELYSRLAARGYSEKKISKNVECEIFQTLVEEVGHGVWARGTGHRAW
jgi:adenylate kinase